MATAAAFAFDASDDGAVTAATSFAGVSCRGAGFGFGAALGLAAAFGLAGAFDVAVVFGWAVGFDLVGALEAAVVGLAVVVSLGEACGFTGLAAAGFDAGAFGGGAAAAGADTAAFAAGFLFGASAFPVAPALGAAALAFAAAVFAPADAFFAFSGLDLAIFASLSAVRSTSCAGYAGCPHLNVYVWCEAA
jgi:hypothetical protein